MFTRAALLLGVISAVLWLLALSLWFVVRESTGPGLVVGQVVLALAFLVTPLASLIGTVLAVIGIFRTTGPKARAFTVLVLNVAVLAGAVFAWSNLPLGDRLGLPDSGLHPGS